VIAITGYTRGLGQAFYNYFQPHTVISFSKSNGITFGKIA